MIQMNMGPGNFDFLPWDSRGSKDSRDPSDPFWIENWIDPGRSECLEKYIPFFYPGIRFSDLGHGNSIRPPFYNGSGD